MSVCFMYRKLLFQILFITIIHMLVCVHHVWSQDVKKATAYTGEQVVLKLYVNPSWNLSVIHWSIYKNITFIATFFENNVNIFDVNNFKDRLKLNTTSGDLTIKNVTAKDALKYKVDLQTITKDYATIFVQLSVQDRIRKPNITLLHRFLDAEKCVISLKCSSLSSNISLIWKLEPGLTEHFCSNSPAVTRESVMWTSLRTNRDVNFTCIATDGTHNESSNWSGKCKDSAQELSNSSQVLQGKGISVGFIIGAFTVIGFTGVIIYLKRKGLRCPKRQRRLRINYNLKKNEVNIEKDERTRTEEKSGEDKSELEAKKVNNQDAEPHDSQSDSHFALNLVDSSLQVPQQG